MNHPTSSSKRHYQHCPACGSGGLLQVMAVCDYTVSGETFALVQCPRCGLRLTQDVPEAGAIGRYYDSPEYISHTDSRKGWMDRLYQVARSFTLKGKHRLITGLTGREQGRLLDFGAGTGAFVGHMRERGWNAEGLEPDGGARARAKSLYGVELKDAAMLQEVEQGRYDVVTLWHVLEHLHDLEDTIRTLRGALKPDGVMLIAVPNYLAADEKAYGAAWAAYDVPRHLYHFTPASVQALAERTGLRVDRMKGMPLDSFYIALLSERYLSGRARPLPAFLQGVKSNLKAWGRPQKSSSVIYILRPA